MKTLKKDDTPVIVNKSGYHEIETLANVINTTKMGHDYIVEELVDAGFSTVANVAAMDEEEMIRKCPGIREYVPSIHKYAVQLRLMGLF